jgi:hypothetical protein
VARVTQATNANQISRVNGDLATRY